MRRFIIGAAVAAAAFASSGTSAQAHHDSVCTPAGVYNPICVSGHQHYVDDTAAAARKTVTDTATAAQKTVTDTATAAQQTVADAKARAREAVDATAPTMWAAWLQGYQALDTIPEPMCAANTSICVSGVRGLAKGVYATGALGQMWLTYCTLYAALDGPDCLLPGRPA